jgi:signal transduction histidine kinase
MSALRPDAATADKCRRFLKSLSQAGQLTALYQAKHPVAAQSLADALSLLEELFSGGGWGVLAVGFEDGRWRLNEMVLADKPAAFRFLAGSLEAYGVREVSFFAGLRPHELSSFCELCAFAGRAPERDAEQFLRERGVRHVRLDVHAYVKAARAKAAAAPPPPESPVTRPAAAMPVAGPAGDGVPGHGWGFGTFIKELVEKAVADPDARAEIYAEAVRNVKEALARRVAEATSGARREVRLSANSALRAENVLDAVADGRVTVDREGRVLMMDHKAEEILGGPLSAIAGRPLLDSVRSDDRVATLSKNLVLPDDAKVLPEVASAGPAEVLDAFRRSLAVVQDEEGRTVGACAVLPHAAKFQEMQKAQDDFVSSVAHELKAPLAAICSALEVVRDKVTSKLPPAEAEFLDISVRNSLLLRDLIQDLGDASKLLAGKMAVRPEAVSVDPLVRQAISGLTPWARAKRISLGTERRYDPAALPPVWADPVRLVQILNNLVSNAIKHTEPGGGVRVGAAAGTGEQAGRVVFSCKDDGRGIAAEDRSRIFEKFTQLAAGVRRGGAGLGLAIVRDLVDMHGGELWLNSKVGKGSTFYFSLPAAGPGAAEPGRRAAPGGGAGRGVP